MGRLEDFPEGTTSGLCRMNRSWPEEKSRAMGGSGDRTDCAEAGIPGDFWDSESPFRSDEA